MPEQRADERPDLLLDRVPVTVPRYGYWKEQIKCQAACPVHTDARGYVRAIAAGDDERAYLIARGPNPLASICGRVCGAPCETACRRGDLDRPIAIRPLKRFVCEQFGVETGRTAADFVAWFKQAAARFAPETCRDREELLPLLQSLQRGDIPRVDKVSVGVVGSGPAGLAAAHDLALLGFAVTIYEMEPVLAGMLAVGVPEYRLPRAVIEAEVAVIRELGVEAVLGCEVGTDVSLPELRRRHERVVIAVGAKRSRQLPIPGADAPGVMGGVEFLRDVSLGNPVELGQHVVVIGGGNVAYDVGRSVLRQTSVDAARSALRAGGARQVTLCSLESLDEMPADDLEIIEGDEEGIARRNSLGPTRILTDGHGRVRGVEFQECLRVFDEHRRFNPLFNPEKKEIIACDSVLVAVGQAIDLKFVEAARDGLEMTERGAIACDAETGRTSAPDLFVAGDLAYGTKLLIHAVASGKQVARAVYQSVTGIPISHRQLELHLGLPEYDREKGYEKQRRIENRAVPAAERIASQSITVEKNYTDDEARCEAGRCLDCGINTIFDGDKCVLCGGCVDVCPELCLRIVSVDRLDGRGEGEGDTVVRRHLAGTPADLASAILKDETICIRCGLCAQRCPTGAITMERFIFGEEPTCPTA